MDETTSNQTITDSISSIVDRTSTDLAFLSSLRVIRKNQHDHERGWMDARELMRKKYETRRTLNKLMVGVGGTEGMSDAAIDEAEKKELAGFDGKIRKAMISMYKMQEKELHSLGLNVSPQHVKRVFTVLDEVLDGHQ